MNTEPLIVFIGGPAGAGKSTLAHQWALANPPAVHIEHDVIGNLICSGKADFQAGTALVEQQVKAVSRACSELAKSFYQFGFNVVVDHVFHPGEFASDWEPYLAGCLCAFAVIRPDLKTTLARGSSRSKFVRADLVRQQHEATGKCPTEIIVDTTNLSVDESFQRVIQVLKGTARTV